MTTAIAPTFHRDLPEHITVTVDGVLTNLDAGDPVPDERPVGRVVVTMPNFVADALAHALAKSWQVNQLFGGNIDIGSTERALAEALLSTPRQKYVSLRLPRLRPSRHASAGVLGGVMPRCRSLVGARRLCTMALLDESARSMAQF